MSCPPIIDSARCTLIEATTSAVGLFLLQTVDAVAYFRVPALSWHSDVDHPEQFLSPRTIIRCVSPRRRSQICLADHQHAVFLRTIKESQSQMRLDSWCRQVSSFEKLSENIKLEFTADLITAGSSHHKSPSTRSSILGHFHFPSEWALGC